MASRTKSSKIKEIYDNNAKRYESMVKIGLYNTQTRQLLGAIVPTERRPSIILDIGCGTGLASAWLKERFPYAKIHGADFAPNMLARYNEKFPSNPTTILDFNKNLEGKLAEQQGMFDMVVSSGAVTEYGRGTTPYQNIYSLLKQGGFFINIGIRKNISNIFSAPFWKYRALSPRRAIELCEEVGFEDMICIPRGRRFALRAIKP